MTNFPRSMETHIHGLQLDTQSFIPCSTFALAPGLMFHPTGHSQRERGRNRERERENAREREREGGGGREGGRNAGKERERKRNTQAHTDSNDDSCGCQHCWVETSCDSCWVPVLPRLLRMADGIEAVEFQ